jgi:hypothetical protein
VWRHQHEAVVGGIELVNVPLVLRDIGRLAAYTSLVSDLHVYRRQSSSSPTELHDSRPCPFILDTMLPFGFRDEPPVGFTRGCGFDNDTPWARKLLINGELGDVRSFTGCVRCERVEGRERQT